MKQKIIVPIMLSRLKPLFYVVGVSAIRHWPLVFCCNIYGGDDGPIQHRGVVFRPPNAHRYISRTKMLFLLPMRKRYDTRVRARTDTLQ